MKILMLIDSLGVGGAETHVCTLASELVKKGHLVYIGSCGGELSTDCLRGGAHLLPLPKATPMDNSRIFGGIQSLMTLLATKQMIIKHLTRLRPDVVHAHTRRMGEEKRSSARHANYYPRTLRNRLFGRLSPYKLNIK